VNSLGLYLKPKAEPDKVAKDFRERFSRSGEFSIYSNRLLRTRIFEIFDQTFAVTYVLRTIAVIVAVIGIFLGLTTLVTERARELGVLRSIGASAAQIRRLLLWESGMIGLSPASLESHPACVSLACSDRRDQSRLLRLDDSARVFHGARWPGHRSGLSARRLSPAGFPRGARDARHRGGGAKRMKRISNCQLD
jgi:hypothetical protein